MKRHEIDVASLVFGLIFLGVSAMWSLVELDVMGIPGLEVATPVLLVSIGLAGLVASISRLRGKQDDQQ